MRVHGWVTDPRIKIAEGPNPHRPIVLQCGQLRLSFELDEARAVADSLHDVIDAYERANPEGAGDE